MKRRAASLNGMTTRSGHSAQSRHDCHFSLGFSEPFHPDIWFRGGLKTDDVAHVVGVSGEWLWPFVSVGQRSKWALLGRRWAYNGLFRQRSSPNVMPVGY